MFAEAEHADLDIVDHMGCGFNLEGPIPETRREFRPMAMRKGVINATRSLGTSTCICQLIWWEA